MEEEQLNEYEIGIMSSTVSIKAPTIESAIIGYALKADIRSNMGLDTLALIAIYRVNGEIFEGLHPFGERNFEDFSEEEIRQIAEDANRVIILEQAE